MGLKSSLLAWFDYQMFPKMSLKTDLWSLTVQKSSWAKYNLRINNEQN